MTITQPAEKITKNQTDLQKIIFEDWDAVSEMVNDPSYSQVVVFVDSNTEKLCLFTFFEHIDRQVRVISVPAGEEHKTLDTCAFVYEQMIRKNIDRESLGVLIGGGMVGDLAGYCCATYMRGIPFITLPTTLLSQVDACVGGKLGVDVKGLKNVVGVFQEPEKVFVFQSFLKTLPQVQVRNGFAEVIKHWLIADQKSFYEATKEVNTYDINPEKWVASSIRTKLSITTKDPKEVGLRKILNFGHTIGHAIETTGLMRGVPVLHGEAIAVGMICESYISYRMDFLTEDENFAIRQFIISVFGHNPKWVSEPEQLVELMYKDKKNRSGQIRFSLLDGIGKSVFNQEVPEEIIYESLYFYKQKW
jgi:3-dehydroquinate synthase